MVGRAKAPLSVRSKLVWPLVLLTCFCLWAVQTAYAADLDIKRIEVQVELQADGSADIQETWQVRTEGYTELYKAIELASNQSVEDFQVSLNGRTFDSLGNDWDLDASFEEKAFKSGQNGQELNWGISQEGNQTYQLSYRIKNFVMQTQTDQMIYWQFVSPDLADSPENFSVTISSADHPLSLETNRIWAFGYSGRVDFKEGRVEARNDQPLQQGDACILLVRIPSETYATQQDLDETFDDYVQRAFQGSDYNYQDYDPNATYDDIKSMQASEEDSSASWMIGGVVLLAGVTAIYTIINTINNRRALRKYYPDLETRSRELEGQYERQAPGEDVFMGYELLDNLSVADLEENYATACILTLVKVGALSLEEVEEGLFNKKQLAFVLDPNQANFTAKPLIAFWNLLISASDDQGCLRQKDLKNYIRKNYQDYESFLKLCQTDSKARLQVDGYLEGLRLKADKSADFQRASQQVGYQLTESGFEMRDQWVKFYNYLKDFSLINERHALDVGLWDQLLIYASALGIADQVEQEFVKLNPDYMKESTYSYNGRQFTYADYYLMSRLMNNSYHQATSSHTITQSMSSGGGGFSSMGGGGGSFGGGGGGAR